MKRSIKIFKSFEEQEAYHFEQMINTTAENASGNSISCSK